MPLEESGSKEALGRNIATEESAGKPPKQAEAIAFATQRKANEDAGLVEHVTGDSVLVAPKGMSVADLQKRNREFWEGQYGDVDAHRDADKQPVTIR